MKSIFLLTLVAQADVAVVRRHEVSLPTWEEIKQRGDEMADAMRRHKDNAMEQLPTEEELRQYAADVKAYAAAARESAEHHVEQAAEQVQDGTAKAKAQHALAEAQAQLAALREAAQQKGGELAEAAPTLDEAKASAASAAAQLRSGAEEAWSNRPRTLEELRERGEDLAARLQAAGEGAVSAGRDAGVLPTQQELDEYARDVRKYITETGEMVMDQLPMEKLEQGYRRAAAAGVTWTAEVTEMGRNLLHPKTECCTCTASRHILGRELAPSEPEHYSCRVGCGGICEAKASAHHLGELWKCEPAEDPSVCGGLKELFDEGDEDGELD